MEKINDGIHATKENAPAGKATGTQKTAFNSTRKRSAFTADEAVIQAYQRGEWLTDWEAHQKHGCTRFRTLMSELRQRGWLFYDEWVEGENRYKNPARWKRYKLLKAGA